MNKFLLATIVLLTGTIIVFDHQHPLSNFEKWMQKHNKVYASRTEYEYRYNVFQENLQRIKEYNSQAGGKASFGENEYMDLDPKEFKALKASGHNPLSHQHKHKKGLLLASNPLAEDSKIRYLNLTNVPDQVDWRGKAVSKVQNQGKCGGCWAFSTVGAMEGSYAVASNDIKTFSVQQVIDCCRINLYGCSGGDPIVAFEECVLRDGVMHDHEYPFTGKGDNCNYDFGNVAFKPRDYAIVPPNDSEQLKMRGQAVSLKPVSVCISSGPAFHFYNGGILDSKQCGDDYDHCVLAIGYGTDENGTDYWLVKNSWGTGWGENGFVRIKRDSKPGPGMCGIANEGSYVLI